MCGIEGRVPPVWVMVTPSSKRAAARSSPETNWEEPEASISTVPPRAWEVP